MQVNTRCVAVLAGTALLGAGADQATKALMVATVEGKPPVRVAGQLLTGVPLRDGPRGRSGPAPAQ
jgi:hypothetical protein